MGSGQPLPDREAVARLGGGCPFGRRLPVWEAATFGVVRRARPVLGGGYPIRRRKAPLGGGENPT